MGADLQSLYQRTVLEHCRSPRNFHVIEAADRVAEGFNPLCGDKVTVYLRASPSPGKEGILPPGKEGILPSSERESPSPEKEGILPPGKEGILPSIERETPSLPAFITELSFQASGCAICLASASMMMELLGGETADEARRRSEQVLGAFHPGVEDGLSNLGDIVALGSVRAYPSRIRCVTLPWRTLTAALDREPNTVSTE